MEHDYLALAARIEAFELDEPGVVDTFSRRLARENGWTDRYTRRVVREYQRFLVLAVTTKHVVSPSEQVDQAWHLHVLHAARYRQFCRDVLGRGLDHGPSDGGDAEHAHFVRAYEQTLSSYEQRFGEPPPSDVWPDAQRRFGADLAVRRVNISEHWVVPKPRLWLWLRASCRAPSPTTWRTALMLGVLSAFVCGCRASLSDHATGPQYLRGFFWLWAITAGVAYLVKTVSLRRTAVVPPQLDPYALAQLAGGPAMAVDSAIASLIARGCVELEGDAGTLVAKQAPPGAPQGLEHEVYGEIARVGRLAVRDLRRLADVLTQAIAEQLLQAELMTARSSRLPLLVALVAPLVGVFRILSRVGTDKPVSFLVVLTVLAAIMAVKLFRPRAVRTGLGDAILAQARSQHEALQHQVTASTLAENGTLPIVFALFGTAAIVGLSDWTTYLERRTASYSSGGCSASCSSDGGGCGGGGCSGGGCGGGCGGCGGGD